MKAMLLAAGRGTRLRPLTDSTPKPLLPIGGKPMIEWSLLLLRQYGIREVLINLHHLGDQIEEAIGDGSRLDLRVSYSREATILGTGGGIKQAEPFFSGERFLVLNGDTLLDLDLAAVARFHDQHGALATMVLREDPEADRWGPVDVDRERRVVRINGQGLTNASIAGRFMFAGVHVMHPSLLGHVPPGRESSIIDAYVKAIECGEVIMSYCMEGYWSDVGTLARYEEVQNDVRAGLVSLAGRGG